MTKTLEVKEEREKGWCDASASSSSSFSLSFPSHSEEEKLHLRNEVDNFRRRARQKELNINQEKTTAQH